MDTVTRFQILGVAILILNKANSLGKIIKPIILFSTTSKL